MSNYLSTLGSDINALLICAFDMDIGGQHFSAGQPFTFLKAVTASIDAQTIVAQANTMSPTNRGLHLLDGAQYLDQLILNNVPYTKKIQSLFFMSGATYENYDWTAINYAQTKLRGEPINIFVYKDNELINDYTVHNQWITINNFDTTARYNAGYSYIDPQLCAFKSQNYPYFKLILYIKGNVANKTSDQTILFEKVALIPQTALSFLPNSQNFVALNFGIIDAEKTVRLKI